MFDSEELGELGLSAVPLFALSIHYCPPISLRGAADGIFCCFFWAEKIIPCELDKGVSAERFPISVPALDPCTGDREPERATNPSAQSGCGENWDYIEHRWKRLRRTGRARERDHGVACRARSAAESMSLERLPVPSAAVSWAPDAKMNYGGDPYARGREAGTPWWPARVAEWPSAEASAWRAPPAWSNQPWTSHSAGYHDRFNFRGAAGPEVAPFSAGQTAPTATPILAGAAVPGPPSDRPTVILPPPFWKPSDYQFGQARPPHTEWPPPQAPYMPAHYHPYAPPIRDPTERYWTLQQTHTPPLWTGAGGYPYNAPHPPELNPSHTDAFASRPFAPPSAINEHPYPLHTNNATIPVVSVSKLTSKPSEPIFRPAKRRQMHNDGAVRLRNIQDEEDVIAAKRRKYACKWEGRCFCGEP